MNDLCKNCENLDCNQNGLYCMCGQSIFEIEGKCNCYEAENKNQIPEPSELK